MLQNKSNTNLGGGGGSLKCLSGADLFLSSKSSLLYVAGLLAALLSSSNLINVLSNSNFSRAIFSLSNLCLSRSIRTSSAFSRSIFSRSIRSFSFSRSRRWASMRWRFSTSRWREASSWRRRISSRSKRSFSRILCLSRSSYGVIKDTLVWKDNVETCWGNGN